MKNRFQMVGYNRTVRLRWLEYTAQMKAKGYSEPEIRESLRDMLRDHLSAGRDPKRGSREKTITLLIKTWVRVCKDIEAFRDDGIHLFGETPSQQHLALHWGMTMAAYPFWRVVAETTGRLLRLQNAVTSAEIQRRVRELLGQRETVARSARYVIRAFVDWGALVETEKPGEYTMARPTKIASGRLCAWLVESLLHATEGGMYELQRAVTSPSLFPFDLSTKTDGALSSSSRLDLAVHGHNRQVVALATGQQNWSPM